MNTTSKFKVELVAAVASVVTGTLLGEGDFMRNLVSGIFSAIVMVVLIEILYKFKKKPEKKTDKQ